MTCSVFKPKPEIQAEPFLTAAECAARTGVTVKALRIYERQGLIKPPRSPNGWRRYGPTELERLNSIVILKGLGLTLSQIRSVLAEKPPSLLRILRIHAESLRGVAALYP
jgi:DNA-binding transcriptional MerR regulator